MPNDKGLPITWSHLLDDERETVEYALAGPLQELAGRVLDRPDPVHAPAKLGAASEAIARAAVTAGPAVLGDVVEALNGAFDKVMGSFTEAPGKPNVVQPLFLLEYDATVRCCDYPPRIPSREQEWLPPLVDHVKRLDEIEIRIVAFLAIANDQLALLPKLIGGTIPAQFEPGRKFQFNVDGFLRYLAAASRNHATSEDIEAAWTDFLTAFPRLLGSEVLTWAGLLAAARAVYTRFNGVEIGAVAQRLHERVTQLP